MPKCLIGKANFDHNLYRSNFDGALYRAKFDQRHYRCLNLTESIIYEKISSYFSPTERRFDLAKRPEKCAELRHGASCCQVCRRAWLRLPGAALRGGHVDLYQAQKIPIKKAPPGVISAGFRFIFLSLRGRPKTEIIK